MRILITVALLLSLLLAGCSSSPSRVLPVDELDDTQEGAQVNTRWSSNTGRGIHAMGDALVPAVDGDRVYVVDQRGRLSSWDLENGRRQWRMDLGQPVSGGPAVAGDLIVVGTRGGDVIAVDRDTEQVIWESRVSSEVVSVPAIGSDHVVVLSGDGRLFAFRRDTGARRWVYDRTMPPLSLRGTSSPVIFGRQVIAGLPNGRLVAVQLEDGSQAWEVEVGVARGSSDLDRMRDVDGNPVISGTHIYVVGYQGQAMSLDLQRGRGEWARELSSYAGLAVDTERVYVTEANGRVWALDRRTGAAVWRQDELEGIRGTAPVVLGDMVAVADDRGRLTVMDGSDGGILARVRLRRSDSVSQAPVVVGGDLLVLTDEGRLLRLEVTRR